MNWISQIFFMVVVTALIGDVIFAMWWLFQLAFMRWSPSLVYNTLRWIVVLFLLPVGYLGIKISHHSDYMYSPDAPWQMAFLINAKMMPLIGVATIIWLIGVLISAKRVLKLKRSCEEDKELNVVETDHFLLNEQNRIQKVLGVRQQVTIIRNPEIDVPYVKGCFKKQIMIPCNKYTRDEITVTLYHELTHVKKHDLFFKGLGWVIVAIQWFNPMVYLLSEALNRWSENDCDAKALKAMEAEFDSGSYYNMLYRMASEEQDRRHLLNFSMLVEDKKSIERRVDYMRKIQNTAKLPKIVTVMLAAAFTFFSTTTAYAAGTAMANVNDKVCKKTEETSFVEGSGVNEAGEAETFIVTEEESKDVPTVYMESDIMLLGTGTFDWDVPAGTRYITGMIYLSKGDVISIACTVRPTTSTYWYGLVLPNGNSKVAQGTGSNAYDFEITTSGFYRVMVQNLSSVEIAAAGSYAY